VSAPSGLEVGTDDREVDIFELTDRLDLQDDATIDQEVGAMESDLDIPVEDRDSHLRNEGDLSETEFNLQGAIIDGFEEARSQERMDLDSGSDDPVRQLAMFEIRILQPVPPRLAPGLFFFLFLGSWVP